MNAEQVVRPTPWLGGVLLVTAAVMVGHGFGRFSYALVLPDMRTDVVGSYGAAGWLGTAGFAAYFVGVFVVSVMSRRVAPTTMVKAGVVGSVLGLAVLSVAPNYTVAMVGMAVAGFAGAGSWIPAPAVVAARVPPERRGVAIGVTTAGVGIGIVTASRVVSLVHRVAGEDAWRPVWAAEAAVGAVLAIAIILFLRRVPVAVASSSMHGLALRRLPRAGVAVAVYCAYGVVYTLFTSYLVAALEDDAGFASGHAALAYSLLGLTSIAGGITLGRVSDGLGRRGTIVGGYVIMAGCAVLVTLGGEPWASISAATFGLLMTGVGAVFAAYVSDHVEPADLGAVYGALTMALGTTQFVGPPFGGWLADQTGSFDATYVLVAVAAVVGALASSRLLRDSTTGSAPGRRGREADRRAARQGDRDGRRRASTTPHQGDITLCASRSRTAAWTSSGRRPSPVSTRATGAMSHSTMCLAPAAT